MLRKELLIVSVVEDPKRFVPENVSLSAFLKFLLIHVYTLYVLLLVVPPRPVQLVWWNWPRGLSVRS